MPTPSLTITKGPQAGARYELTGYRNVLGRHSDCEVVLDAAACRRVSVELLPLGRGKYRHSDKDLALCRPNQ